MERKKRGVRSGEREREMRRAWEEETDGGASVWEKRKTVKEKERERDRDREKDEESMRIGERRRSPGKSDVPKPHAYNESEHPVKDKVWDICYIPSPKVITYYAYWKSTKIYVIST